MKTRIALPLLTVGALAVLAGCSGNKADESGEMKSTAPVNNNAPEAKNAPAAPSNPSIVYPGLANKRRGP